jgi:DNA polymerase
MIDLDLVQRLSQLTEQAKQTLTGRLIRVTNGQVTTPNQVAKLREWLAFHGVELADLRRNTVRAALAAGGTLSEPARSVLQARLDASRSSTAKLAAIAAARSSDGRVRGCFQYYGANRTGRWAGRRVQPQNLYRGSISDVPSALVTVMRDTTPEDLEALYEDSAMGIVASCLRSTIVAAAGHRLVIMDLSQIEARVLAWIAVEDASLACFRRGDDIYVDTARRVGSRSRQLGKVLVLACGFGMGATRFQQTAAGFGLSLDLPDCERMVAAWRQANKHIVWFWWETHKRMMKITRSPPGTEISFMRLVFRRIQGAVLVQLPSGRHLVYRRAHIATNETGHAEFCYMGSGGGGWQLQRSWPGKIVENVVQAIARDVLADHMIALHKAGVPLIATVHDELIAEVPEPDADRTYDAMQAVMRLSPVWAPDMPMGAAGFIASRYHKK